jgi:negative regulator of sigma E activity
MPQGEQREIVYNNNEVTIVDKNAREVTINLDLLSPTTKYKAILYTEGENA